jgi:hypothetical protein
MAILKLQASRAISTEDGRIGGRLESIMADFKDDVFYRRREAPPGEGAQILELKPIRSGFVCRDCIFSALFPFPQICRRNGLEETNSELGKITAGPTWRHARPLHWGRTPGDHWTRRPGGGTWRPGKRERTRVSWPGGSRRSRLFDARLWACLLQQHAGRRASPVCTEADHRHLHGGSLPSRKCLATILHSCSNGAWWFHGRGTQTSLGRNLRSD